MTPVPPAAVPPGRQFAPGPLYRLLVGPGRVWFVTHDLDGTLLQVGPALAEALGYAAAELVGRPLAALCASSYGPVVDSYLERMRAQERSEALATLVTRTGESQRVYWWSVRVPAPDGREVVLATIIDVAWTERGREASARRSQMALTVAAVARETFSSLEPGVVAETVVVSLTRLLDALFAAVYRRDSDSDNLVRVAHTSESDSRTFLEAGEGVAGLALREGRMVVVEDVLTDPRIRYGPELRGWYERRSPRAVLGVPLVAHGRIHGVLIVGAVPGRAFSEEEIGLAETLAAATAIALEHASLYAESREQAAQYRALLDGSIQGLYMHQDGVVVLVSRTILRMLGYTSPEELVGQPHWVVLAPGERARLGGYLTARLAGQPAPSQLEFQALRKDGSEVWIEAVASVVMWHGRPAVMGTWVDISKRKQAQAEQARTELALRRREQLDALGQLVAGVAHDVNNILGVVSSSVSLVRSENAHLPSGAVDSLDRAARATRRGAELVQRLLAFARRQPLVPRATLADDVLDGLTALLGETLGRRTRLVQRRTAEPWTVVVDPGQLETCLLNLVINARDAMPSGGTVTLASANVVLDAAAARDFVIAQGEYVVVSISDDGPGMPADVLARAVEPFFTTKPFGRGNGLGLSMVDGFARQSGGALVLESAPGRGTTASLYLPRAEGATADATPADGADADVPRQRGATVLVLEDDDDMRATVATGLTRAGYHTLVAATAEEALATLAGLEPVDVLFSDVVLGEGSSGPAVAARGRAWRPDLKVLFTSGYAGAELGELEASEAPLLAKPYEFDELERKLEELLSPPPVLRPGVTGAHRRELRGAEGQP